MTESKKPYDISVDVKTHYLEEQSDEENGRYAFAYTITITNCGTVAAQLLSRHWVITDSNQNVQEVRGDGVVGEQPFLRPGEAFRYTSGTLIDTPIGTMHGSYQMVDENGNEFDANIEEFMLVAPRVLH